MKFLLMSAMLIGSTLTSLAHASTEEQTSMTPQRIKITLNHQAFSAVLEDNASTRALVQKLPLKVKMDNRYGRELVHRLGAGALPSGKLRKDNFQVGDLIYWPPKGSLVILYKQDGDRFARQQLGHIEQDVSALGEQESVEAILSLD